MDMGAGLPGPTPRLAEDHRARAGPPSRPAAAAELVRRQREWAERTFTDTRGQELVNEIADVEDDPSATWGGASRLRLIEALSAGQWSIRRLPHRQGDSDPTVPWTGGLGPLHAIYELRTSGTAIRLTCGRVRRSSSAGMSRSRNSSIALTTR